MAHQSRSAETRKRTFQVPAKPVLHQVPPVGQLREGPNPDARPSLFVMRKIGQTTLVAGFDIETHDWVERKKDGSVGELGHWTLSHPDDLDQRIVQLGWAIGDTIEGAQVRTVKECLVKPSGYRIATKATNHHHIEHDRAVKEGQPLQLVLEEFMADMIDIDEQGGRVVAHHLEFDACIIKNELGRAGLRDLQKRWCAIARKGVCTMDPNIGRWIRACAGKDFGSADSMPVMSLQCAIDWVLPKSALIRDLTAKLHTAGADAQLHRLLYVALMSRVAEARRVSGPI